MSNLSSKVIALTSILFFFNGTSHNAADRAFQLAGIHDAGKGEGHMVTKVNELRNNNTVAHANTQLIQKREAELVIRMLNAIWDYIEDIEKEFPCDNL